MSFFAYSIKPERIVIHSANKRVELTGEALSQANVRINEIAEDYVDIDLTNEYMNVKWRVDYKARIAELMKELVTTHNNREYKLTQGERNE